MLERTARWSYQHRWRMLAIWVVALVGFGVLMNVAGGPYATNFSLPGTESQAAFDLLKERFPGQAGDQATIVVKADQGVADPSVKTTIEGLFTEVAALPNVDEVVSPFDPQRGQSRVSTDGTIAFATVQFDVQAGDVPKEAVDRFKTLAAQAAGPGLQVELGGGVIEQSEFEPPGGAESIGLLAAIIILLLTFGSLLAMGLPILVALFGIGIGLSLVLLFANFLSVPNFTPQLASMIGIGVGIDYALFIVTRYRQGLEEGRDPESAVLLAMATAGRAVFFAGDHRGHLVPGHPVDAVPASWRAWPWAGPPPCW